MSDTLREIGGKVVNEKARNQDIGSGVQVSGAKYKKKTGKDGLVNG
jgi:hypothetical protein